MTNEHRARDQILDRVTADAKLAGEMYRNADNIAALAEGSGMSTLGAFVLYVRWVSKINGPRPRMAAELLAEGLDAVPASQHGELEHAVRREVSTSQKAFDNWCRVIERRIDDLPAWLVGIAQDMASGAIPRPKKKKGRPPGAGALRHESAQRNVAQLVYVLDGRIREQGDKLALYNDTDPDDAVTVCSIVAQALSEEDVARTPIQVRDAWHKHKDSFPDKSR